LNALVGLVSLIGAEGDNLMYIEGGNSQVCDKLVDASAVDLRLKSEVIAISKGFMNSLSYHP